ncbi:MAG: hypothetical protein HY323_14945 [Betaproteobacteria bacterium]|nr:hypothetical protein [Betaproteobacteria bacterium]
MKTVWISSLAKDEARVKNVMAQLRQYGLGANGHFWTDAPEKLAWLAARDEMVKLDVALWLVLVTKEQLDAPSVRYGLSLLAIAMHAAKGDGFPIVFLAPGKDAPGVDSLPTPLRNAALLQESAPWQAKLVARASVPPPPSAGEYRLDVYGNAQIGQWFELGPARGGWTGAMFGVSGAEIDFHAVGPKGRLPEKTVLNYAQKGLKLAAGDREYAAWAVQNALDPATSYFLRVRGHPDAVLFGEHAAGENAELFVLKLK